MKKTTKGAFAAGAAGVLLLGGAGSLAYWTATGTATTGAIHSGSLKLTDTSSATGWTYANGSDAGSAVSLIVPGDQITTTRTFTVDATGDHLTASVSTPSTISYTPASTATETLNVGATYDVGGRALASGDEVTSADNGKTLTVKLTVTFPYGDATAVNADDTQGLNQTLDNVAVTLTQDQSSGNNPNA